MYQLVLNQLITMALIAIAGFAFAKIVKVNDKEQKFLSKLLLYFVNTCLIIDSFNLEYDAQKFKRFLFAALIALIIQLAMIFVSFFLTHSKNTENRSYNHIDRLAMVLTNCGFIGIPLIRGVFGNEGVFYLMGYLTVFNLTLWTYGYYVLSGSINLKKIITNPNIIAVILGLIIFCIPSRLPNFIAEPVHIIGSTNSCVAMILLGLFFATFKLSPKTEENKGTIFRLIKFIVLRLVICSLVNLVYIFTLYKILPQGINTTMMLFVPYICSMCASATSVPGMACIFNKDSSYASLMVSLTSLFCLLTIPSFVALGNFIIEKFQQWFLQLH